MMRRLLLIFGVTWMICAAQGSARADEPDAAEVPPSSGPEAALQAMEAGRFAEACPTLKSLVLKGDSLPITRFHYAQCYDKWGKVATAAVAYDDYLAMYDGLSSEEQKGEAERERVASIRREELSKRIPKVVLRLPDDAPASTRVLRRASGDEKAVPLRVGVPLPIDPGEHFVITEVPGRPPMTKRFFVQEGKVVDVDLPVAPASQALNPTTRLKPTEPVPSQMTDLEPKMSARRVAAYTFGGVGVVGLLGGVVTGVVTWAYKNPITSNCSESERLCNQLGQDSIDTANVTGMISNFAFPIGAAALGTGLALYLTDSKPWSFGSDASSGVRLDIAVTPDLVSTKAIFTW